MQRLGEGGAAGDLDRAAVALLERADAVEVADHGGVGQAGSCSVVDTTTLAMVLNLSAKSPSRWGQAAEKPS